MFWSFLEPIQSFSLGPVTIHFYGLMYAVAAMAIYFIGTHYNKARQYPVTNEQLQDVVLWTMLAGIIGGRLGFGIFYNLPYFLEHPVEILMPWKGGMSIHGGIIGGSIGALAYCWRQKINPLIVGDIMAIGIPIGFAFGRLGNLVNMELLGPPTTHWLGIPCQVAEYAGQMCTPWPLIAIAKNIILAIVLIIIWRNIKLFHGGLLACFLIGMGIVRFIAEYWRTPDPQLGLIWDMISMGQILAITTCITGVALFMFLSITKKSP